MAAFDSKYVVCPFYHSNDNNRVCCDGVSNESSIHIVFGDSSRRRRYMMCFCNDIEGYKRCKVCEMLREKWGDDDGK
jgi:hypothetical protein